MTCKDCIHYDLCNRAGTLFDHKAFGAEACNFFKNKNLWLELPCAAGSTAYRITKLYNGDVIIAEGMVFEFTITHESSERDKCRFYFWAKADTNYTSRQYSKWCDFEDFGKTVFLTREAAEAALEARNAKP